ncbi:MAG: bifunctional alpha,alpha-trehalose-phosphate synthase (UDP-forming)/trehalose-phosphatase, partial [Planctomycetes bacterium]|nr:bifunctional alpha,alpha-trehalose-phosphate synthase (UDP-forming)/trehalose-phosphatase [Planctomycetota bacterium]
MSRLLIISNRLPVNIEKRGNVYHVQPSVGGLATGLSSFYKSKKTLGIGWPGIVPEEGDDLKKIDSAIRTENCVPVLLSREEVENYYYGFCNKTIWPLFHYFSQYTVYNKREWETYRLVNKAFFDVVIKEARQDDTLWIHDYHLMLLPKMLREAMPEVSLGFFLHIPFPSFEVFRQLPWRKELIEGLLGVDLIGFHTYDYVRHFINSVRGHFSYEPVMGLVPVGNRVVKVDAFPMGIDYQRYAGAIDRPEVKQEAEQFRKIVGDRKIILSIDRLDYSKGIAQRLEAFSIFLGKYPEYKEKVTMILVVVPSRTKVTHYMLLKRQIDELVGRVNGEHGTMGWIPVWYLYRSFPFDQLAGLYSIADVGLVTPLRDGMNLVAKEFIATKTDGRAVLILSEMAGTAKELGEAIIINPNNIDAIVEAIREALTMSEGEQIVRNRMMQQRLKRYDVERWAGDFLDSLKRVKEVQQELLAHLLTTEMKNDLISRFKKSSRRLLLLDYDGTLVPLQEKPEYAKPDKEILGLLKTLAQNPKNEIVVVSGRDKATLEAWLSGLPIGLVAEHGVWLKDGEAKSWEMIEPLMKDWKEDIRPVLDIFVDRTPGAFIEEKEFSLVWHFRRGDPELNSVRAKELKETLLDLTANLRLDVLEGKKVIEIKNTGVNKGRAALRWIGNRHRDFILAIGDDWTDEDMFSVVDNNFFSIKVGLKPSLARYNVETVDDVRELLK